MIDTGRRRAMRGRARALAALFALPAIVNASPAAAQQTGEPPVLPPVEVSVTRDPGRSPLELPFAVISTHPDSARPGQRHISLDETLLLLPGVNVASRHNPTQDPRISIRGFGARSAFGVRGVRILRDGMPLTLPDGQTPVDYLDLESVGRVEVLRGSASALYGNAAGGVIELRTEAAPSDPLAATLRGWGGGDGFRRGVLAGGGTLGALRYQGSVARTTHDGWREYSRQRTTHAHARAATEVGGTTLSLQALVFDMPVAENPGALTLEEWRADPTDADPNYAARLARKAVQQTQVGLLAERRGARAELSASLYGGTRLLDNPLPFAVIDIDRVSYGATARGGVAMSALGVEHRLSTGVDVQRLSDDRRNFANCNGVVTPTPSCPEAGVERGALRLDQRERVTSVGVFVRDELQLGRRWTLSAGVRADRVHFDVADEFIEGDNPDDSGERTLRAISPMAGLLVRVGLLNALYANVATSFETPTATELGNQPDGSAGINRELDPQRAVTVEAGAKGVLGAMLRYDVALYTTRVTDELVPFEIAGGGTRRYFRNAGRTARRGAELALGITTGPVDVGVAYNYAHFRFREYVESGTDHSGNRIPGVPRQQLQASATARADRAWLTAEAIASGSVIANDANTVNTPGYEILHLRAGGDLVVGAMRLSPVIGVHNVFDRQYVGAVSVNATNGRYYEPAPGRTFFAGLTLGYGR